MGTPNRLGWSAVAYYAPIQYCPDPGRMERANVGLILHVPLYGIVIAKHDETIARAIKFFDLDEAKQGRLRIYLAGICWALSEEKWDHHREFVKFAATRGNDIKIWEPRTCRLDWDTEHGADSEKSTEEAKRAAAALFDQMMDELVYTTNPEATCS